MRDSRALAALAALVAAALPATAASAAVPSPPNPDFYAVTSATELDDGEYARMASGGIRTLRLPFFWPHIEPQRPQPPAQVPGTPAGLPEDRTRWGPIDEIVGEAATRGIRILPFVYGTPDWVAGDDPLRPPLRDADARAAWQDFVHDLAQRYGPGGEFWDELRVLEPGVPEIPIVEWQIWNEPNSPVFWSPRPRPAEYAAVVALAEDAIRAADPEATVVLAGMFGTPTHGIPAWDFLRRFHESGGATGAYDAYALHPYAPALRGIAAQVARIRRAIAAGPAPAAPLWITEIGWPTDGPRGFEMVKSEQGQKRLLARSFRLFLTTPEWGIAKIAWFVWRDNRVQTGCTVCRYSGLFTEGFRPKPAWRKLTQFTGGAP